MDSKGDVKHFFGVRFAWHVPESCCCSSVSQLRLQGISANGSACSRGQKIVVLWIPKVTWSIFSACVLLGMCPNPAAVRVFRNSASKGFISANGFACSRGQKIVVLWIPKVTWSTFSACVLLGMCPNPAAVRVFRNMPLQGISANGSACSRGQKIVVLWIPKVTWSTFSACVLLGMCPNPAAVRVFRNCASKGFLLMVVLARKDKRLLFLPESCCCSSVSQLRLQGISANGSACSRGQKIVVLWIPKVTWSIFSACVLLGMCPNPAAVRVFRNCANSQLRLQGISANGSACSRGQKIVVLWIPKVTWSTFSACVLLGMCPNPAAVRVFRNCASKGFLLMVLLAREDKRLLFYGFQRWREAFFRRAFCLACARILLLFECFATAPPRDFC